MKICDIILEADIETIINHIKNGLKVDEKDDKGNTALMTVANHNLIEKAELLIKNGADLAVKNHSGKTALVLACQNGHLNIVKLLIQNRVDVTERHYQLPLSHAINNNHAEIVKTLLKIPIISYTISGTKDTIFSLIFNKYDMALDLIKDICEDHTKYSPEFYKDKFFIKIISFYLPLVNTAIEKKILLIDLALANYQLFSDLSSNDEQTLGSNDNETLKLLKASENIIKKSKICFDKSTQTKDLEKKWLLTPNPTPSLSSEKKSKTIG